jgi:hypothetical protein
MLTTIDNPYNPFDDIALWQMFDKEKGYNTCEYLARIVEPLLSDDLSEKEVDEITVNAMNEIIKHDPLHIYIKVFNQTSTDTQ